MNGPFAMAGHHRQKTSDVYPFPSEIRTYGNWFKVIEPFSIKNKLFDIYENSMMITCLDLPYNECFKVINTLYCIVKLDMIINQIKLVTECNTTFGIYKSFSHNVQSGSNMTETDLCVNKPHCAAAVRP